MEQNTVYTHNGVQYITDWYTQETMPLEIYSAIQNSKNFSTFRKSAEVIESQKLKAEKSLESKKAFEARKTALLEEAFVLSKEYESKVTKESYEEWRIANGYLWKVTSPKGNVYTEVLKQLTVDDPLFVVGNAIRLAVSQKTGAV